MIGHTTRLRGNDNHMESSESGPTLRAMPFGPGVKEAVRLLTAEQRAQLLAIATQVHLPARMVVYREGTAADSIFFVSHGVAKSFRDLPSGKRRIVAFLFADDVFGLAEAGHYVNTVQTVTPVAMYRIGLAELIDVLHRDARLEFQFLRKLTHELRKSQRHTVIVGRRDAVGRVAMFLRMLEQHSHLHGNGRITMPMTRSDTANYLGLSLEAVSRACRMLERTGVVTFTGRHDARIVDRARFDRLVARL